MTDYADKKSRAADAEVERIFAEVAAIDVAPDADLMERVLADASAMQVVHLRQPNPQDRSVWSQLSEMIGGWPAFGGLATAGIVGLWIGAAPPAELESLAAGLMGNTETVELFGSDLGLFFEEENDG